MKRKTGNSFAAVFSNNCTTAIQWLLHATIIDSVTSKFTAIQSMRQSWKWYTVCSQTVNQTMVNAIPASSLARL